MPWVRLDDHFDEHPKVASLSDSALALWVTSIAYSNRNLTDGFIPTQVGLGKLRYCDGNPLPAIRELEHAGLWVAIDDGWRIHDFDKYQPSRADVESQRADLHAKRSAAGKKGAEKRWGKRPPETPGQDGNHGKADSKAEATDITNESQDPKQTDAPVPGPVPNTEPGSEEGFATGEISPRAQSSPVASPKQNGRNPHYDAVCLALDMPERGDHEGLIGAIASKARSQGHEPDEIYRRAALHLAVFNFPLTPGSFKKRWDELGSKVVTASKSEREAMARKMDQMRRRELIRGGDQ